MNMQQQKEAIINSSDLELKILAAIESIEMSTKVAEMSFAKIQRMPITSTGDLQAVFLLQVIIEEQINSNLEAIAILDNIKTSNELIPLLTAMAQNHINIVKNNVDKFFSKFNTKGTMQ